MKVRYDCIALHPIPQGRCEDGVFFTKEHLEQYGYTLSDRALVLNHHGLPYKEFREDPFARDLPFPDNKTLEF